MASETADEKEKRLVSVRTNLTERIENESVHEREERLEDARERGRERRVNDVSHFQEECVDSREQYLHERGIAFIIEMAVCGRFRCHGHIPLHVVISY